MRCGRHCRCGNHGPRERRVQTGSQLRHSGPYGDPPQRTDNPLRQTRVRFADPMAREGGRTWTSVASRRLGVEPRSLRAVRPPDAHGRPLATAIGRRVMANDRTPIPRRRQTVAEHLPRQTSTSYSNRAGPGSHEAQCPTEMRYTESSARISHGERHPNDRTPLPRRRPASTRDQGLDDSAALQGGNSGQLVMTTVSSQRPGGGRGRHQGDELTRPIHQHRAADRRGQGTNSSTVVPQRAATGANTIPLGRNSALDQRGDVLPPASNDQHHTRDATNRRATARRPPRSFHDDLHAREARLHGRPRHVMDPEEACIIDRISHGSNRGHGF